MTKVKQKNEIYRCNICGNIVTVLKPGGGELVCCNQPMELLEEKTQDEGLEKHVPVIEKTDKGIIVRVGSESHPMQENHYIYMIDVVKINGGVCQVYLKPGHNPEAEFEIDIEKIVRAREYCTIHGLWQGK